MTAAVTITPAIAFAAAADAANRNMRKHDRVKWNEDDRDIAVDTYVRLMALLED